MEKKPWLFSRSQAITFGFTKLIDNFGTWLGVMIEAFFIIFITLIPTGYFLFRNIHKEDITAFTFFPYTWIQRLWTIYSLPLFISLCISLFFIFWMWMNIKRIALDMYYQQETGTYRLFAEPLSAFYYLIASIMFFFIVVLGLIIFIVPGIMAFAAFRFYGPAIIEYKFGPFKALGYSFKITNHQRIEVLLFVLLTIMIAKIVGIFSLLGIPFIVLTDIYLYKKLDENWQQINHS
jgi:hypothetical protein